MQNPAVWRGKTVAVVARYSFRENGRFLSEEGCENRPASGSFVWPAAMLVRLDASSGPKLPEGFDIDATATTRQLRLLRKATPLGKFRFGSLEYDRWAVAYGRVEEAPEFAAPPGTVKPGRQGPEPAPLHLVIRGDSLIFVIPGE
jgi:hypothetical protein